VSVVSKREEEVKKGKWVYKKGSVLGSGFLNPISSPKGFKACLKVYPGAVLEKYMLIEVPLDSTQEAQRAWLKYVNKYYKELQADELKRHKDIKADWGQISGRKEDIAAMVLWVKNRYRELKKDKSLRKGYGRFYKILDEMQKLTFGSIKYPELSIERIKALYYSKIVG